LHSRTYRCIWVLIYRSVRRFLVLPGFFSKEKGSSGERDLKVQIHPIIVCRIGGILLKVRDVIKIIEADGGNLVTTIGSHRQYKHPEKPGRITLAGHPADDLAPGTFEQYFFNKQKIRNETYAQVP